MIELSPERYAELMGEAAEQISLGLGISDRARWLVFLGLMTEKLSSISFDYRQSKKGRGRPSMGDFGGIDCFRAFCIWKMARAGIGNRSWTNREWINVATQLAAKGILDHRAFPQSASQRIEQSVSKGKSKLKISKDWMHSEVCEKIDRV